MNSGRKTAGGRAKPRKQKPHPREARTRDEALRRIRQHAGFDDSLTPAQKTALDNWTGPENLGPLIPKRSS